MAEVKAEYDVTTGGNKQTVISDETIVIDVVKKKNSMGGIGKFFAYSFGGFGMFFASILFLTIIGIPIAIGLFFVSLSLIYAAQGRQQVVCPHCKKKQPVMKTKENFDCIKCRKLTVINWK